MQQGLLKLKATELEWLERMDVSVAPTNPQPTPEEGEEESATMDPEDDFRREMLL